MIIKENYSLRHLNTFGIDVQARYFAELSSIEDIRELLSMQEYKNIPKLVLGGGSNILFTKNYDGMVLKINLRKTELTKEDHEFYYIKAGAGEIWHEFVLHCIKNNFSGIENLSLIPGNVGAAPIQNIGAYGVELESVFTGLEAVNIHNCNLEIFTKTDCKFGYRNSVFKSELKGEYIIGSVTLKLRKKPVFNTSYGTLRQELDKMGTELSIKAVSDAVCKIRRSKLPDPAKIGNAGSFFKNPLVSNEKFEYLKSNYPGIIGYKATGTGTKLAAAWLIEQCGWKGKRSGDAGVHENHALVLTNYGNATGSEIFELSEKIYSSVKERFGVILEREVNIV